MAGLLAHHASGHTLDAIHQRRCCDRFALGNLHRGHVPATFGAGEADQEVGAREARPFTEPLAQ
jgi:hypothetical protein